MFNLGIPELVIIAAAVLLVFGPKRLPELGRSLGKGLRDFKKALGGDEGSAPSKPVVPVADDRTVARNPNQPQES